MDLFTYKKSAAFKKVIIEGKPFTAPNVASDVMELKCPPLLMPGEYFKCSGYFRQGTKLKARLRIIDEITGQVDAFDVMDVPGLPENCLGHCYR